MDLRSLQLFRHLAKSLHFGKTAEAMFVSPPTLSRAITRLEEECGTVLFVRNNRSVKLTVAGEVFSEFAETTLESWHQVRSQIGHQQTQLSGLLSFYCSVTASHSHLPKLLDKLNASYPQIELKLDTGDHALALDKVQQQQVDIAIAIHTPDFPAHVGFQKIDTVPLVLIVPKSTHITTLEDITWPEHKVVMPGSGPSKRIIHHWFAEQGVKPKVYANVAGNEAIVSMVALGLGVGFVPKIVLDSSVAKTKVNSIEVANIEPYSLGLCYLRDRANEALMRAVLTLFRTAS
ncbi:HTH-type transcriptional activator IlvY [Glaciecola sp. MH2013]|uniref:HTH-type transcriptional activator IlvY n=1 Tax=Glaciecola sp. MH2013 TaxID=2785524 RepID=UPI00189FA3D4|nr:HTH-type transcriptional activator IlvY [Glaciecola sp. MH2013]MBF7074459.1 HTH-type transcriptional activator IlvY [Glaciecola sp. MH2013]